MGELFKYFEGWDIQAVRREAKEEVEKAKEEAKKEAKKEAKEEIEKAKKKAKEEAKEEANKKANEKIEKAKEENIQKFVRGIKKCHVSKEMAITQLVEEYELSEENAVKKVAMYW